MLEIELSESLPTLPAASGTDVGSYQRLRLHGQPLGRGDLMLSPMSDVFSLALIVVEMLTGQLPYGVAESTLADSSVTAPYIHAGMLAGVQVDEPRVRDDLASILNRALSDNPEQRYPSAIGRFHPD